MASNKNQHFVPRGYLRPFTLGRGGKAIPLFNLDLGRSILGAPVKGQCSGDRFYGENSILERRLQDFEGRYATLRDAILAPHYHMTGADSNLLREFWLLQHTRTEAASRRIVELNDQMEDELGPLPLDAKTDIKGAVQTAMNIFFDRPDVLSDLDVRLIRNHTDRPFITSDDPAVMTNRWYLTDPRVKGFAPGHQNAGMIALLPLDPTVMAVVYDGALHTLLHENGWLDLTESDDVDAFNEHQVLNCNANLYFGDPADREYVADLSSRFAAGRLASRFTLEHLVLHHEEPDGKVYRVATAEEVKMGQTSIVHSAGVLPIPTRWPSQLRWRSGGTVYDSGTGEGYARKGTRTNGESYRKVRVRA